jgi:chromosome segregation ATPase
MADTIENRVSDIEEILAHLPKDLDARFAGADARAGARFDRLSIRLQALEARVQENAMSAATQIAGLDAKIDAVDAKIDSKVAGVEAKVAEVDTKLDKLTTQVAEILVLMRSPKAKLFSNSRHRSRFHRIAAAIRRLASSPSHSAGPSRRPISRPWRSRRRVAGSPAARSVEPMRAVGSA